MSDLDARAAEYLETLRELLAVPLLPFSAQLRVLLPMAGGVYHITQERPNGPVSLYVGKTSNLRQRINDNHYKGNRGGSGLRKNPLTDGLCPDEAAVTAYLRGCHV